MFREKERVVGSTVGRNTIVVFFGLFDWNISYMYIFSENLLLKVVRVQR